MKEERKHSKRKMNGVEMGKPCNVEVECERSWNVNGHTHFSWLKQQLLS